MSRRCKEQVLLTTVPASRAPFSLKIDARPQEFMARGGFTISGHGEMLNNSMAMAMANVCIILAIENGISWDNR